MITKGSAYYAMLDLTVKAKGYKDGMVLSKQEMEYLDFLHASNELWFEKAEALGWREQTSEQKAQYLKDVAGMKEKRESQGLQ